MKILKVILLATAFLPCVANAQQVVGYITNGGVGTPVAVSSANPLPVTGTVTPSGTQNVNLTQVNGTTVSNANAVPNVPSDTIPISSTAGTGNLVSLTGATVSGGVISFTANNQAAVIDTQGYGGADVFITGTFTGLVLRTIWSNNPAGPFTVGSDLITGIGIESTNPPANTMQGAAGYVFPKEGRYLQLVTTAFSTGTVNVQPVLVSAVPKIPAAFIANQVGYPIPTYPVAQNAGGYTHTDITTATTTTVKSGAGTLHTLTIGTYVASATITLYDNTAGSGTTIQTITLPSTVTGITPITLLYDEAFTTGLTVVTSGATDVNVAWK